MSETPVPILSVVTPVLNGASYIGRALASVRMVAESGITLEHIVVDGGSVDGTLEIVERERAISTSPITHVVSEPDEGQADAINRGFGLARGRYLGWLNADDVYVPEGLTRLAKHIASSASDVVLGRCVFVDPAGNVVFRPVPPNPVTPASLLKLLSGWYAGRSIVQPEAFISRTAFDRHGAIRRDLHFTMDHEYWLRLAVGGASFEDHNIVVARQLVHPGQKTSDNASVVREQVRYGREYLDESGEAFGDEYDTVERELIRLRRKLDVAERFFSLIDHTVRRGALTPPVNSRADAEAMSYLARCVRKAERLLCVGLDSSDILRAVELLRPTLTPTVVGRVPSVSGAYDVVVARYAHGWSDSWFDMLHDALRPEGHLCVLGMVDPPRVDNVKQIVRQELANRLTWQASDLIAPGEDQAWIDRLSRRQRLQGCSFHVASTAQLHANRYGQASDDPLLALAKRLQPMSDSHVWISAVYTRTRHSGT